MAGTRRRPARRGADRRGSAPGKTAPPHSTSGCPEHLLLRDPDDGGGMTFEEFAATRLPALLNFAAVLAGDRALAEDLAQDVMIRAYSRWDRIGGLDQPEFYVRKMILNEYPTAPAPACSQVPCYYAWYEFLPSPSQNLSLQITPGDMISAEVRYVPSTKRFYVELTDVTTGASFRSEE